MEPSAAENCAARGGTRVFNFACGPAVEVQNFLRSPLSEHAELTLADFNGETLEYLGKILDAIDSSAGGRLCVSSKKTLPIA